LPPITCPYSAHCFGTGTAWGAATCPESRGRGAGTHSYRRGEAFDRGAALV
jgi:hypothetical protein